jgi:hypothetical protein
VNLLFGGGTKADLGRQKAKKQILLPPKEQKSKNAYGGYKKANKAKSKICYFAILLFNLFCSKIAKKQKSICFSLRICCFAILLFDQFLLSESKKAKKQMPSYSTMLFCYILHQLLRSCKKISYLLWDFLRKYKGIPSNSEISSTLPNITKKIQRDPLMIE